MLTIIDTHKEDYDLCLLAAKTVLKVVNNHQIVFDYQEMAIIKKFNKALDNLGMANSPRSDISVSKMSNVSGRSPSAKPEKVDKLQRVNTHEVDKVQSLDGILKADLSNQDKLSRAESLPGFKTELSQSDKTKQASKICRTEESQARSSHDSCDRDKQHQIAIIGATP